MPWMPRERSTARGMSRLALRASSPIEVTDSNPTRMRMAMQAWMTMNEKPWGAGTEVAVEWNLKCGVRSFGWSASTGSIAVARSGA